MKDIIREELEVAYKLLEVDKDYKTSYKMFSMFVDKYPDDSALWFGLIRSATKDLGFTNFYKFQEQELKDALEKYIGYESNKELLSDRINFLLPLILEYLSFGFSELRVNNVDDFKYYFELYKKYIPSGTIIIDRCEELIAKEHIDRVDGNRVKNKIMMRYFKKIIRKFYCSIIVLILLIIYFALTH